MGGGVYSPLRVTWLGALGRVIGQNATPSEPAVMLRGLKGMKKLKVSGG